VLSTYNLQSGTQKNTEKSQIENTDTWSKLRKKSKQSFTFKICRIFSQLALDLLLEVSKYVFKMLTIFESLGNYLRGEWSWASVVERLHHQTVLAELLQPIETGIFLCHLPPWNGSEIVLPLTVWLPGIIGTYSCFGVVNLVILFHVTMTR
jgi:hypothetical protein